MSMQTWAEKEIDNGFILCFCCGGYVEPGDYIIIEHCDWNNINQTLLKNY